MKLVAELTHEFCKSTGRMLIIRLVHGTKHNWKRAVLIIITIIVIIDLFIIVIHLKCGRERLETVRCGQAKTEPAAFDHTPGWQRGAIMTVGRQLLTRRMKSQHEMRVGETERGRREGSVWGSGRGAHKLKERCTSDRAREEEGQDKGTVILTAESSNGREGGEIRDRGSGCILCKAGHLAHNWNRDNQGRADGRTDRQAGRQTEGRRCMLLVVRRSGVKRGRGNKKTWKAYSGIIPSCMLCMSSLFFEAFPHNKRIKHRS